MQITGLFRRWRAARCWLDALTILALATPAAFADFSGPFHQFTDSGGQMSQTAVGAGPLNRAQVASVSDDSLQVDLIGPNLHVTFQVVEDGSSISHPTVVANNLGQTYVAFSQISASGTRDVFLSDNRGPSFREPRNLSNGASPSREPSLALDLGGKPHLVWTTGFGQPLVPDRLFYHDGAIDETSPVGPGSNPGIFVDSADRVHVVYTLFEELYYVNSATGEFGPGEPIAALPSPDDVRTHVGLDGPGNTHILYTSGGAMYFSSKFLGEDEFSVPVLLDSGEIRSAEMHVASNGTVSIVYALEGDVYLIQGSAESLPSPALLFGATPESESNPDVVVDRWGYTHVSFIREGEVFYVNDSEVAEADFSAETTSGPAPLTVQFDDTSNGEVQIRIWDFGDGAESSLKNPVHTFQEPGKYTVRLTVFNADKQSTAVKQDFITVLPPINVMEIPDQAVLPGQQDVWFPLLGSHVEPIQGFQMHALYDPDVFEFKECTLEFTVIESLDPEVWECNIFDRSLEIGVIFELNEPIVHPTLAPGGRQTLVNLVGDVKNRAPQGSETEIQLVNDEDMSPILNIFTINSLSVLPLLRSSTVRILPLDPPLPRFFTRGDVDGNGSVQITDAVVILGFLFLGGVEPVCMDAADFADDGEIEITSAIKVFQFLFLGGPPPTVPFPRPGLDPTDDNLPPCE